MIKERKRETLENREKRRKGKKEEILITTAQTHSHLVVSRYIYCYTTLADHGKHVCSCLFSEMVTVLTNVPIGCTMIKPQIMLKPW